MTYLPPYDSTFALNVPIPSSAATDGRSESIVARLAWNATQAKVMLSNRQDVPPIYESLRTDPLWSIHVGGKTYDVRAPEGIRAGDGKDYPLLILDPDLGMETRLWQAIIDRTSHIITANGFGRGPYTSGNAVPTSGNGTGSGLSILAGLIRPQEVAQGVITHALRFAYSAADATDTFRAPAVRTDQPKGVTLDQMGPTSSRMEMGMRLQLVGVDPNTRTVPGKANDSLETKFLRMICRALCNYGMVMLDGTASRGIDFGMEHSLTAHWDQVVGLEYYGSYGYLLRTKGSPSDGLTRTDTDGIPWGEMRVLA